MQLLFIRIALLTSVVLTAATASSQLRAGSGKSDIKTSPEMWPVNGFTSQHDPLSVRVLLLEDNICSAIVVIDQTSISETTTASVKSILKRIANVDPENALVVATHTFSAPHVFGVAPLAVMVVTANPLVVREAHLLRNRAQQSFPKRWTLQPRLQLLTRKGDCSRSESASAWTLQISLSIAICRHHADDGWAATLPVSRIRHFPRCGSIRLDGEPLALLMNEAVQSSIMDQSQSSDGGKVVTADLAGAARKCVEDYFGDDAVAFLLIGAAGDKSPILQGRRYVLDPDGSTTREDFHDAGFTLVELIGERLGTEAVEVAEKIESAPISGIQSVRRELEVDSQDQGSPRGL